MQSNCICAACCAEPQARSYMQSDCIWTTASPSQPQQSQPHVTRRTVFDGTSRWVAVEGCDSTGQSCAGRVARGMLHSKALLAAHRQCAHTLARPLAHTRPRDPHVRGAAPLRSCSLASYPPSPRHHVPHPAPLSGTWDGSVIFPYPPGNGGYTVTRTGQQKLQTRS